MNHSPKLILAGLIACGPSAAFAAYDCVEVELFAIDKSEIRNKKDKRAATIPPEALATLQQAIVLEIPISIPGVTGFAASAEPCPDPAPPS